MKRAVKQHLVEHAVGGITYRLLDDPKERNDGKWIVQCQAQDARQLKATTAIFDPDVGRFDRFPKDYPPQIEGIFAAVLCSHGMCPRNEVVP